MSDTTSPFTQKELSHRHAVIGALGAALITIVLGAIHIGRSFNYDEAVTYGYFVNGGSVRQALTTQLIFNNHQMFSVTQAIGWRLGLVGESAQRLGPLAAGATVVGVTVWWSARRGTASAAMVSAVVLIGNPVFFGQIRLLRGYALSTAAVVVAGVALHRSWSDPRTRWLVLQAACMVVAVTSHAYAAVTIAMLALASAVLGRLRWQHLVTWVGAALTAVAIHFPLLDDIRENSDARGSLYNSEFPRFFTRLILGGTWPIAGVIALLIAAGLVTIGRQSRRHALALVSASSLFIGVVVIFWLVVQPRDLYGRFFVSVVPLLAYLAGRGTAVLPRPHLSGPALGALLAALLVPGASAIIDQQPTIRDAAALVNSARNDGKFVCGWQPEPLRAYTSPVAAVAGIDDLETCDVYVSVLGLSRAQRAAAEARFAQVEDLGGGILVWSNPI